MRTLLHILATAVIGLALLNPATARADDMTGIARAHISAFVEAVIAGPGAVAPLLAPEYQIMRSNGIGYDRDGYINRGAGSVNARPQYELSGIVATAAEDLLVTRYFLDITQTIDGKPVTRRAPRLTVFRKIDGAWKISAHANFAHVE